MRTPNSKPRLHDRRPAAAAVLIGLSVIVVTVTERDLHRRPDTQIQGSKSIWRLVSLNAIGAIAYLAWGHTHATES
jgi:hypothetical protein